MWSLLHVLLAPCSLFNMESTKLSVSIKDVSVIICFPKIVKPANLQVNMGKVLHDEAATVVTWTVGNLDEKMRLKLTGEIKVDSTKRPDEINSTCD